MELFDLHCDTLGECLKAGKSLFQNDMQLDVRRGLFLSPWVQCFAVWIPDEMRGSEALQFFDRAVQLLDQESVSHPELHRIFSGNDLDALKPGECGVLLTVESGAVLAGSLEQLQHLYQCGVHMMTLTWNGSNELGGGVRSSSSLTPFGVKVVREMERLHMAIDLSHASERLFYSVVEHTEGPLVASHSNSRSICPHLRNLTDEQFCLIRDRGGVVGLNFAPPFLCQKGGACAEDIYRHAEHFLELDGEKTLAIGSDFDGTSLPEDIYGIASMESVYEIFLRHGCSEALIHRIFFKNAYDFFHSL